MCRSDLAHITCLIFLQGILFNIRWFIVANKNADIACDPKVVFSLPFDAMLIMSWTSTEAIFPRFPSSILEIPGVNMRADGVVRKPPVSSLLVKAASLIIF